jgi:hypothetical protein
VGIDFAEVMRNAKEQGIDLQEITIQYENLMPDELDALASSQIIVSQLPGGGLLAKFPENGEPLFPHRATGVIYLGA